MEEPIEEGYSPSDSEQEENNLNGQNPIEEWLLHAPNGFETWAMVKGFLNYLKYRVEAG